VPPPRRALSLLITAAMLVALGALVAQGVSGALGISFRPVTAPAEHPAAVNAGPPAAAPALTTVAVPADKRLTLAADAVAAALRQRGAAPPAVVGPGAAAPGGLDVRLVAPFSSNEEAFRLSSTPTGGLTLEAGSAGGAAAGLYTVADRIRSGETVLAADDNGKLVSPRLGLRLTDLGAVGLEPTRQQFVDGTDYNLNTDVVGSAILPGAPWVDQAAVATVSDQYRQFVDHALTLGYNGVVIPGFLEYLTLAGTGVYPAGDPHVERARAMVAAFGPVWRYAHDMGMKVYFKTDMLALSPPLKAYLQRAAGLDATSPKLWSVYQAGLRELYAAMPFADGLMLRVGEGGSDYKLAGWDYFSEVDVSTAAAVQAMLRALLQVSGGAGKDLIFRTWSVGLNAVGNMHTNPDSYRAVLDGIDDPHLIVSTKYVAGDYYSYLPLNPTLTVGSQRRIIEFQSRREFEGFGSLPDDLGDLEQQALRHFLAANPNIVGVWDWTQDGGPLVAGPMTLYPRTGFWQLWDLDVYLTSRLAWDPDVDTGRATADWIRQTFSTDPATVTALSQAFALSRSAITDGLYIGPFARQSVEALGQHPTPMMWIFEWDIVTGDSAVLDSIYDVSRDKLDDAIAQGDRAVATARRMRDLIDGTDAGTWRDPALRQHLVDTAAFEVDLFRTLGAYRTMVLRHAQWLDTGSGQAKAAWKSAESAYLSARAAHLARYGGDVDLPAWNFTAADLGQVRANRDPAMAWLARVLLALILLALVVGALPGRFRRWPGGAALRGLWIGATQPWRAATLGLTERSRSRVVAEASTVADSPPASRLDRLLVWLVPAVVLAASRGIYTWFEAPAHLIVVLGAWLLFAVALRLLVGRADPFRLWAAVGGAALVRTVILLVALVNRGPGRYWYLFWTAPNSRFAYITVAFAAFCWVFAVAFVVLRDGYGLPRRRALGRVLAALGVPLVLLGVLVTALGLERALTFWNDQLALLPWGMARILGITTYLGIPASLPRYVTILGAVLLLAGLALAVPSGRRRAPVDGGGRLATPDGEVDQ
jgi:Glycosyl hydrolase family 67 C-terminus